MTPIEIRPAKEDDVVDVLALDRSSTDATHWPETRYRAMLAEHAEPLYRVLLVAADHAAIVGYAVGALLGDEAELESVVVAEASRRRGVGRALSEAVCDWATARNARIIHLEVRQSNSVAQGLYVSMGFVMTGKRPAYYSDPQEDALLMSREFLPSAGAHAKVL